MTGKDKDPGRTGGSSDKYLSPRRPYTGDGRTSRQPHDPVRIDPSKR